MAYSVWDDKERRVLGAGEIMKKKMYLRCDGVLVSDLEHGIEPKYWDKNERKQRYKPLFKVGNG